MFLHLFVQNVCLSAYEEQKKMQSYNTACQNDAFPSCLTSLEEMKRVWVLCSLPAKSAVFQWIKCSVACCAVTVLWKILKQLFDVMVSLTVHLQYLYLQRCCESSTGLGRNLGRCQKCIFMWVEEGTTLQVFRLGNGYCRKSKLCSVYQLLKPLGSSLPPELMINSALWLFGRNYYGNEKKSHTDNHREILQKLKVRKLLKWESANSLLSEWFSTENIFLCWIRFIVLHLHC